MAGILSAGVIVDEKARQFSLAILVFHETTPRSRQELFRTIL